MRIARPTLLAAATAAITTAAIFAPLDAGAAPAPKGDALASGTHDVIVVLRNQRSQQPGARGSATPRSRAVASDQATVARRAGVTRKSAYVSLNAFATKADATDVLALRNDPAVAAVVPDLPLRRPTATPKADGGSAGAGGSTKAVCPANPSKPLLEPEALQTMNVAHQNGGGAQSVTTGKGVKVAWLADGIDINNQDFVRADGSKVFVDYQDFTGEGRNAPSSALEAFGDASAIAAQGRHRYDLSKYVNPAHPLPKGCNIVVRGVAPGASMVGLKVFGEAPTAPTSRFIGALDWAVSHDKVDVINESFGANPYPDTMDDPISLANNAAIAAGVTVVASTGDAGTNSTIGSPATSTDVIAAAATTSYRLYAQTTSEGIQFAKNYASNGISGLSSGGFGPDGKVPDVAAPGDLGWALCSTNVEIYQDCGNFDVDPETGLGKPTPIVDFGGTSMSSPLIAGTAALVIAAYRSSHGGASPKPGLVKRLITGTAKDLGHPATEQGAGIVDALAAVQAAKAAPAAGSSQLKSGGSSSLLPSTNQLNLSAAAGATMAGQVTVQNLSNKTRTVGASTRSLTRVLAADTGSFDADLSSADGAKTFVDEIGRVRGYKVKTFAVKPGADRLDVSLAYQVAPTGSLPRFFLIDPNGTYQAYSIPQGPANYARAGVRYPKGGTWKLYFQSGADPDIAFDGTVNYKIVTSKYARIGSVSPATRTLAPGKRGTFTVSAAAGRQAGDRSASLQLVSGGHATSVPVSLRTYLPTPKSATGRSSFTGVITGGNGRSFSPAQTDTYYLDVPRGTKNLSIGLSLDGQVVPDEQITGYLVDPNGQTLSAKSNLVITSGGNVDSYAALQLNRAAPEVGRWTLVLQTVNPVAGTAVEQPFTGVVSFAAPKIATTSGALPTSAATKVKAGTTTYVKVKVTNNGVAPQTYFADPRLSGSAQYPLASQVPGDNLQNVPLDDSVTPTYLVPGDSSSVTYSSKATIPVGMDAGWAYGDPEIYNSSGGKTVSVTAAAPEVAPGPWYAYDGALGPFSAPVPASAHASYSATVTTKAFDPFVTSSTGDYWLSAFVPVPGDATAVARPASAKGATHWVRQAKAQAAASKTSGQNVASGPLTLAPNTSGYILVALKPTKNATGSQVNGALAIETFDPALGTADKVASLPYSYTVG